MAITVGRTKENLLEIEVNGVSSWEGFENLVRFLEQDFNAHILEKNDGPDARSWNLEIRGQIITIQHLDTRGNWFFAHALEGESLVVEIGNKIKERLAKYN